MIYVADKDFDAQAGLIEFIGLRGDYRLVAWLYPEAEASSIASISVESSDLEQVTTYTPAVQAKHTAPTQFSSELLARFVGSKPAIKEHCDSLALYEVGSTSWAAASIGHEGMSLVRDVAAVDSLVEAGFPASLEAPSWW